MADSYDIQTFFRPTEVRRAPCSLPADVFNRCRRLLNRAKRDCVFVPIRTMQFLAVIDQEEVIFIDSQGGYQVVDGAGGRCILLSWRFPHAGTRDSLSAPVTCELIHYRDGLDDLQHRLVGEFTRALIALDQKWRESESPLERARIIPLR